jgi:hypothetical protein
VGCPFSALVASRAPEAVESRAFGRTSRANGSQMLCPGSCRSRAAAEGHHDPLNGRRRICDPNVLKREHNQELPGQEQTHKLPFKYRWEMFSWVSRRLLEYVPLWKYDHGNSASIADTGGPATLVAIGAEHVAMPQRLGARPGICPRGGRSSFCEMQTLTIFTCLSAGL